MSGVFAVAVARKEMSVEKRRFVIGVSGASGAPVAVEVLRGLAAAEGVETHLVMSEGAAAAIRQEMDALPAELAALADVVHDCRDIGASIASGTFRTDGMVVVPCSMKSLAGIACGYADNLLLRAADVCLKERRRLILAVRETPLGIVHLRNMLAVSEMGALVFPLMVSYYHRPHTVGDMTRQLAGRLLDLLGVDSPGLWRWDGGRNNADC